MVAGGASVWGITTRSGGGLILRDFRAWRDSAGKIEALVFLVMFFLVQEAQAIQQLHGDISSRSF